MWRNLLILTTSFPAALHSFFILPSFFLLPIWLIHFFIFVPPASWFLPFCQFLPSPVSCPFISFFTIFKMLLTRRSHLPPSGGSEDHGGGEQDKALGGRSRDGRVSAPPLSAVHRRPGCGDELPPVPSDRLVLPRFFHPKLLLIVAQLPHSIATRLHHSLTTRLHSLTL